MPTNGRVTSATNPLDLMATRKFPLPAGVFVVGGSDTGFKGAQKVYGPATSAGMDVRHVEVPGGHSFAVGSVGLAIEMDWLVKCSVS